MWFSKAKDMHNGLMKTMFNLGRGIDSYKLKN